LSYNIEILVKINTHVSNTNRVMYLTGILGNWVLNKFLSCISHNIVLFSTLESNELPITTNRIIPCSSSVRAWCPRGPVSNPNS